MIDFEKLKDIDYKPTEEEIDSIYQYLSMYIDNMTEEEKTFWASILFEYDPEFLDDEENDIIDE